MEALILLAGILVVTVIAGGILGIVAFVMVMRSRGETARIGRNLRTLSKNVAWLTSVIQESRAEPPAPPAPPPAEEAVAPPVQVAPAPPPAMVTPLVSPPEPVGPRRETEWWTNFEEKVGKRWMVWAGVLVLFISAALFLKYAFENQWIGPTGRIVLGVLCGLGFLAAGDYFVRRMMRPFGQGLIGGGLAILYVSLFAAFQWYHLIPAWVAFSAMVLVTAAGMALAVLHNAVAVGFLAVIGGFLTPIMLSTGKDARDALFGYLVILNLGVLGVAFFKRWRALDLLAFVGTYVMFAGWYVKFYAASAPPHALGQPVWNPAMVPTLFWLTAFFLIFLLLPFAYHLRYAVPATEERFVMALANAAFYFFYAYRMLRPEYAYTLGFVVLGMSACYVTLGAITRQRVQADARGLFGFIALSVIFLTIAVPLHLKAHGITLVWAAEAPVLLFLGYNYRYFPVRVAGLLVLALSIGRLFTAYWPLHEHAVLFTPFLNRHFVGAVSVPIAAAAYALIHHSWRKEASPADRFFKIGSAIVGGLVGLVLLHGEVGQWFESHKQFYFARCAETVIWALGAVAFLVAGVAARSPEARWTGLLVVAVALVLALSAHYEYRMPKYLLFLNARFLAGLLAVLVVFAYYFALRRYQQVCPGGEQTLAVFLAGAGLLFLLVLLSVETYEYCFRTVREMYLAVSPADWQRARADWQRAEWKAQMSLSVVWSVYAAALLTVGFLRRRRGMRLAALGLFGITALKVVLVDMATVQQAYRIISFMVLGILMVGASYLYHLAEKRLQVSPGGKG
jgi:uncharacterized membrane protein